MQRTTIHARLLVAIVAMLGLSFATVGTASAGATQEDPGFGICHATEAEGNPYVYIEPDDASYDAHLAHIGIEGGDRFATEAEADEGECFADTPTEVPTQVPPTQTPQSGPSPVPTEEPTDVPNETTTPEPTSPGATAEPTDEPVSSLPETGTTPTDSNGGLILAMTGFAALLLLAAAAMVRRNHTR